AAGGPVNVTAAGVTSTGSGSGSPPSVENVMLHAASAPSASTQPPRAPPPIVTVPDPGWVPAATTSPPTRYSTPSTAGTVYVSSAVPGRSVNVTAAGVTSTGSGCSPPSTRK